MEFWTTTNSPQAKQATWEELVAEFAGTTAHHRQSVGRETLQVYEIIGAERNTQRVQLTIGTILLIIARRQRQITKGLDSVYLRSSQNSQPNSDTSDVNSGKERGRVFRIARSDPSPAF